MADATLMELVKEVRWKTLKVLEDVDETQARWTLAGLNNSILWHAGHSLVVVEHLSCMSISGGPATYPREWFEKFSWSSNPAAVTEWPALSDIVARLKDQRTRLFSLIEGQSQEQLARVFGKPPRSRTLMGEILHGLHDESNHQGEIYLMKKLWKLKGAER